MFHIIILSAIILLPSQSSSETVHEGGLLFESQGVFSINGEVRLYQRKVDTGSLVQGMQYMNELSLLYRELCTNIERQIEWDRERVVTASYGMPVRSTMARYQVSIAEHTINEATKVCTDMGGHRPVVMNKAERAELSRFMIENGIDWAPAAIKYSPFGKRYVIQVGGAVINPDETLGKEITGAFPRVYYGGSYNYYTATGWGEDGYVAKECLNHSFIYTDPGNLKFALAFTHQMSEKSRIVCEIPPKVMKSTNASTDPVYLMAYQNCLREIKGTLDSSKAITEEAQMITKINMLLSDAKALENFTLKIKNVPIERFQTPKSTSSIKKKIASTRFSPETIAREVKEWSEHFDIDYQSNSWSPLAFLGKAFGPVFGLMSEDARPTQGMIKSAKAIGQLAINQQQIEGAIEQVIERVESAMAILYDFQAATLTALTEQDIRLSLKFFQNIMLDTLSRYIDIVQQAAVHKTSLYALNDMDLIKYVRPTLAPDQWIPVSVEHIKSTIAPNNESLVVLYDVPITSKDDQYVLYSVTPIPVYINNSKLVPEVEFTHFAWSKKGDKYIPLTADEYQFCISKPLECTAHAPVMSTNAENTACVINTHMQSQLKCPMKRMPTYDGLFFQRHRNTVFYSIAEPMRVYINCESAPEAQHAKEATQELAAGFGKLTLSEACSIVIPRRGRIKTIMPRERVTLGEAQTFQLASFKPTITNVSAELPEELLRQMPQLNLTMVELPSPHEVLTDTIHPKKSIPFLASVFILALMFGSIVFLYRRCKARAEPVVTKLKTYTRLHIDRKKKKLEAMEQAHQAELEAEQDVEQGPPIEILDDMLSDLRTTKTKYQCREKVERARMADSADSETSSGTSRVDTPPPYRYNSTKY